MEKLLAVDLDCTLLDNNCNMSEINLEYITKLKEVGVQVVPVTGRTYYEIPESLRNHKDIDYIIYSNGAGIFSKSLGQTINSPIDLEDAHKIYDILFSFDTFVEDYTHGHILVDKELFNGDKAKHFGIDMFYIPELFRSRNPIDNFKESIYKIENQPELINVFFADMNEREVCRKRLLSEFPNLELTTSMRTNLEMMHASVNKGNALVKLCNIINLPIESTYAVGDSRNDIKLINAAAHSFAVSNACDDLKLLVDKVICSNQENILPYLLENQLI